MPIIPVSSLHTMSDCHNFSHNSILSFDGLPSESVLLWCCDYVKNGGRFTLNKSVREWGHLLLSSMNNHNIDGYIHLAKHVLFLSFNIPSHLTFDQQILLFQYQFYSETDPDIAQMFVDQISESNIQCGHG